MADILVTGFKGQLGNEIVKLSSNYKHKFYFTDKEELDMLDSSAIEVFFQNNNIDYVINCAAYTAVDKAESDTEAAYLLNAESVKYIARNCSINNITLIHISTDYVYDGKKYEPYSELDQVNPLSVYGDSKLKGEQYALKENKNTVIIRTSWLYSSFGANFVKTIMKYAVEREKLTVVFDQIGTPTYAYDLAYFILENIEKFPYNSGEVYNFSNEGVASWFDFASSIIEYAGINCEIEAISSDGYPQKAVRPKYSVMDKAKLKNEFSVKIPEWRSSLKNVIGILLNENN